MASPQAENGYTKIANEILEQLVVRGFTVGELTVLLFVIRKTYGFHKTTDRIPLSQFVVATGFSRSNICRILNRLVTHKSLVRKNGTYGLQKNWEQWLVTHRSPVASDSRVTGVVTHGSTASDPQVTKTSDPPVTLKRNKETIQKKRAAKLDSLRQELLSKRVITH